MAVAWIGFGIKGSDKVWIYLCTEFQIRKKNFHVFQNLFIPNISGIMINVAIIGIIASIVIIIFGEIKIRRQPLDG